MVRSLEASDVRDYLFQFAKHNCCVGVNEMLIKGVSQYVGPDKLSLLEYIQPDFIKPSRDGQYFYFDKSCWLVTRDSVKEMGYENISHHIWEEQRRDYPAKYLGKQLVTFRKDADTYSYELTEDGHRCHYLQFLINASNFTWRKKSGEVTPEEENENHIHLLSKLCAIGYMLMEAKDSNVARAVIGMDGKQSEVGESNGRSGKSLIGELMRNVMPIAYIPGKNSDIFKDQFVWNDVMEKTKLVFIDDVLQNFNFEFLFPNITGDWSVNYKGGEILSSEAGTGLVTADAMAKAFGTAVMAKVIIVGGMCGIITSWNSFMIGGSRALYSMAESYMIPPMFAKLHPQHKTPINALFLIGALTMLAPFAGRGMMVWICDAGNFGCCLAYCMVSLSFLILRKKEPDMPRPYRVPAYKFVGTMAVLMSGCMVLVYCIPGSGGTLVWQEWLMVGGWSLLGVVFFAVCKFKYKEKFGSLIELISDEDAASLMPEADDAELDVVIDAAIDRKSVV